MVGALAQLDGSDATDADGDPLSFRWSFVSVPVGSTAILSNTTAVNPTFTTDLVGTYEVKLLVNDGMADGPASAVTITVVDPAMIDDDGDGFTENQGDGNDADPAVFPSSSTACYDGPAGTEGMGICLAGTCICQANGIISACSGQVLPGMEIPGNGIDRDCDGADAPLPIPPEPETVAPPLDRTISTTIVDSTVFL